MEEAGRDSYYLQDDLGSPMQLVGENGEIRESYGFDEFGQPLHDDPEQWVQPFGFTGCQMEAAGGMYFAQARRYDAGTGRFVSEDKIAGKITMPFTLNRYVYCLANPLIFVDLNGLDPEPADEGDEAHRKLQQYLSVKYGVDTEVYIPHASSKGNGNYGKADIVYEHDGIAEIYEIKPGSYAPGAVNYLEGKIQLQKYLNHYNEKADKGQIDVYPGTSLNKDITTVMFESSIHPDKLIKYYIYPSDPGMIYWGYIKKPKGSKDPVIEKEEEREKNYSAVKAIETTGEVAFAAGLGLLAYEVIKWGVAWLTAAYTGGASMGVAGCIP